MHEQFDKFTRVLSSGVHRRDVIKALGAAVFAVTAGARPSARQVRPTAVGADAKNWRSVTIDLEFGSRKARVVLPDRLAGRITLPGQSTTAIVPTIALDGSSVELSLYEHETMTLKKRVTLPLRQSVRAEMASLPGLAFVASHIHSTSLPAEYQTDCSVSCCWGGSLTACGACCDPDNPDCGSCCDSGCCPGCAPVPPL